MENLGKIHSFESFGTVDGPGIRYVVFMQGCHLKCKYCHNRDTWNYAGGTEYTTDAIISKIERFKLYINASNGGVTVSGGEPLLQAKFLIELFKKLKQQDIHTALDTAGSIKINDDIKEVKDGYGENFLIKNGYAVAYTKRSREILDINNKNKALEEQAEIKRCEKIKKELKDRVLTFKVKTGKQDQVFGTISTKQIANELEKIGYKIDKKKIVLDDAISSLGYHEVKINLHKNVIGIVTVELIK